MGELSYKTTKGLYFYSLSVTISGAEFYRGNNNVPLRSLNGVYHKYKSNIYTKAQRSGAVDMLFWDEEIFGTGGWLIRGENVNFFMPGELLEITCPIDFNNWNHTPNGPLTKMLKS